MELQGSVSHRKVRNKGVLCRTGSASVLTSSLAALLHAVLVDVEGEQPVGVPSVLLVCVRPAGAARCDGGVQEEGSLLGRGGTKLTLVLELGGERGREGQIYKGLGLEKERTVTGGRERGGRERERSEVRKRGLKRGRDEGQLIGPRHTFLAH